MDARVAADDDGLALDALAEDGAKRAYGGVVEVALGDAANVVLTKTARVHLSQIPRKAASGKGIDDLAYVLRLVFPDDQDRIPALDHHNVRNPDGGDQRGVVGDHDIAGAVDDQRWTDHGVAVCIT